MHAIYTKCQIDKGICNLFLVEYLPTSFLYKFKSWFMLLSIILSYYITENEFKATKLKILKLK